jgi:hypothetical protein
LVLQAAPELLGHRGPKDLQEHKGLLALLVHKEPQDHKDLKVHKDHKVLQAQMV